MQQNLPSINENYHWFLFAEKLLMILPEFLKTLNAGNLACKPRFVLYLAGAVC